MQKSLPWWPKPSKRSRTDSPAGSVTRTEATPPVLLSLQQTGTRQAELLRAEGVRRVNPVGGGDDQRGTQAASLCYCPAAPLKLVFFLFYFILKGKMCFTESSTNTGNRRESNVRLLFCLLHFHPFILRTELIKPHCSDWSPIAWCHALRADHEIFR